MLQVRGERLRDTGKLRRKNRFPIHTNPMSDQTRREMTPGPAFDEEKAKLYELCYRVLMARNYITDIDKFRNNYIIVGASQDSISHLGDSVILVKASYTCENEDNSMGRNESPTNRKKVSKKPKKFLFVRKDFSDAKFKAKSDDRLECELFWATHMPYMLSAKGFRSLPRTYYAASNRQELRESQVCQEYIWNGFTLSELYPGYSSKARDLERRLVDEGKKPFEKRGIPLGDADEDAVMELDALNRVFGERDKLLLRARIQRLYERNKILKPEEEEKQKEADFAKVLKMLGKFQKSAGKSCLKNPYTKGLVYDEEEFMEHMGRKLHALNPNLGDDKKDRVLDLMRNFLAKKYLFHPTYEFNHGDANPNNIMLVRRGTDSEVYFLDHQDHLMIARNPLIDTEDCLTYLKLFCGMKEKQYEELWSQKMADFKDVDPSSRYFTHGIRCLIVTGALSEMINQITKGKYAALQLEPMQKRLPAYREEARKFFGGEWKAQITSLNAPEQKIMGELSDHIMKYYLI